MSSTSKSLNSHILCNNSNTTVTKANKIHVELLSYVLKEINEKIKKQNTFDFSNKEKSIINKEDENNKYMFEKKNVIKEKNSNDTSFSSNDDEDGEDGESSSDMSCSEESIIN